MNRVRLEKGAVIVLVALSMVAILGFTALVIDVAFLVLARLKVWTAVDAGALAGAQLLSDCPVLSGSCADGATELAIEYVQLNYPSINPVDITISFRCRVGDRNVDGQPDARDIPAVCDPGFSFAPPFVCEDGICEAPCDPSIGDNKCNTIAVEATKEVPYHFAPVLGFPSGSTGALQAAACKGTCGAEPTGPLDLVEIIDRTGSMSSSDLNNAKNAARVVLELYNPEQQWVGLGALGPSHVSSSCSGSNSPANGIAASSPSDYNNGLWVPVGLTGVDAPVNESYLNADGSLNTSSLLVKAINCLNTSGVGTNLATAIQKAKEYLLANGRTDVKKGIIFMTDGAPNYNSRGNPSDHTCQAAFDQAAAAKAQDIEIFTVGYGIEGADCPDSSGAYAGELVTELLADIATDSSDDGGDGPGGIGPGCDTATERASENADGDHFLCEAEGEELDTLFIQAAEALAGGIRLVQ